MLITICPTGTILKERPYVSSHPQVGSTKTLKGGTSLNVSSISAELYSGHTELHLKDDLGWGHTAYLWAPHTDWETLPNKKASVSHGINQDANDISQKGVDLIKEFEGLELEAYVCPAGVVTIGYGSTHNVSPGMCISEPQAEQLLKDDLRQYVQAVRDAVEVPITQGMFDALVAFTYNVGGGALRSSTLLRLLNAGKPVTEVADQLLRWDKAGGRSLPGLTRRRKAERELFLS